MALNFSVASLDSDVDFSGETCMVSWFMALYVAFYPVGINRESPFRGVIRADASWDSTSIDEGRCQRRKIIFLTAASVTLL